MNIEFLNGESVKLSDIPTVLEAPRKGEVTRTLASFKLFDGRFLTILGNAETHKLEAYAMTYGDEEAERYSTPASFLKGEAAHEVAVGPVHAGVIEPGHFRFQCMGEDVHSLAITLGYQTRGAEELIVKAHNDERRLAIAETVAGDTSIAARLAASKALNIPLSHSNSTLQLLLELERIANHVGDLGALSGDVAYLPTAAFCGRIRGEYLNMTAAYCGNRFGRGGAKRESADIKEWFLRTKKELFHALDLLFSEEGAIDRFEHTGTVPKDVASKIGLVGVAGRASGLTTDSRIDFPMEGETITETLVSEKKMTGDVLSRARQRYEELKISHALVERLLETESTAVQPSTLSLQPSSITVAVVEAWRGELVHIAIRGENGELVQYKIVDPSVHNWLGLAQALRGEQISNFPICNKSFNLSYCGVDK
ncbi:MAG: hypothetical protein MJ109_03625 [Kiritimatiellae bacterium]|nr:hypothetical protein [Kiritimatiellia bacterium]